MKTCFILLALAILTAGTGCTKKNERQDKKATDKKLIVTAVKRNNMIVYPHGAALCAKFGYPRDVTITPGGIIYVVYLRPAKFSYP